MGMLASGAFSDGCPRRRPRPAFPHRRHAAPLCRLPDAFAYWNQVSSVGSYVSGFAVLVFFAGIAHAFWRRQQAAANPWGPGATTLEWTLSSPPPFHAHETLPTFKGGAH